ncbi:Amino acid transporter, transmembrane [Cynara cardunculus var. scolymus]|uniref:Amino acid transporter, transmembrane n=1 Tax=Cynara cardunculus var. scolymus TaxID=59895 RepID=A0A103YE91_CYNCS|nr:Amino acid transporter, transmembrane [Cynara cardunculus var. scolymus]
MVTVVPTPRNISPPPEPATLPKKLDAGALFVLKSRAPALLSLPFALALLGWESGVMVLVLAGVVTFYSYNLLSLVLEHYAYLGRRQLRFRDMAHDILGPGWGRYYVGPLQLGSCYGAVIACTLLGGQIYILVGKTKWKYAIIPFYCDIWKLYTHFSPNPIFPFLEAHQPCLPHLVLCLLCLYNCWCDLYRKLESRASQKLFFDGNRIVISNYFSVGISGYWAFGNQVQSSVLQNFMDNSNPLLPKWFLLMTNGFTVLQVAACTLVYLQPSNVVLERRFANPEKSQLSMRNFVPRLISRSLSVIIATTFAAMLPFFGDIMALFGAFGCIPLDFILPMIFYNLTFKPSKKGFVFWVNTVIGVVSTGLSLIGAVASVRQIILDARTYRLFADM